MEETNFNEIKAEILKRAKAARACTAEYERAYKSENISELLAVVKDNFWWAVNNSVLTIDLIERFKNEFSANEIYANESVSAGYVIASNATVEASGNATVWASGNATVRAWGNAYCTSYTTIECKIGDNAIYRVRKDNEIFYASESIKFTKIHNS